MHGDDYKVGTLIKNGMAANPSKMQCKPLQQRSVRAALRRSYHPACFTISHHQKGEGHWDLIDNETHLDLSVVARGSRFYGVYAEGQSIINLRRERPAVLRSLPWRALRELFEHLAQGYTLPLPETLARQQIFSVAGVGRQDSSSRSSADSRWKVPLSAVIQQGHTLYVNGNTHVFDTLDSPLRRTLMAAVDASLTIRDIGEAAGVRPWISSGGTESGLHYDYSDNIHCSLSGRKTFSLYAPNASTRLYPVEFSSVRTPDYALRVHKDGHLHTYRVDDADREDLMYSAVDERAVNVDLFPGFREALRIQHTQEPGECTLIPAYWWHNIRAPSMELNFALSFYFPNAPRRGIDYGALHQWIGQIRDETMQYLYWRQVAKSATIKLSVSPRSPPAQGITEAMMNARQAHERLDALSKSYPITVVTAHHSTMKREL